MLSGTIAKPVEIAGRGLFSGAPCLIRVDPAEYGQGIAFRAAGSRIPALPTSISSASNHTLLEGGGKQVRVTEHLLCALWAAGIDTADIVVLEGPELPNFDGSALPFYSLVSEAGVRQFSRRRKALISDRMKLGDDSAYFLLEPDDRMSISYHFSHAELGGQDYEFGYDPSAAVSELLPARTFATQGELEAAQAAGFLSNTDESAGLVIRNLVPNQPLRFENEYARHKVLDFVGDMYLVPFEWPCRVTAYRTGHAMNHKLARLLWREVESGRIKVL